MPAKPTAEDQSQHGVGLLRTLSVMTDEPGYLPRLESRREFVDYLEGHPVPGASELQQPGTDRKLVRTYMLETAGNGQRMPDLASRFPSRVHLHRLDDTLFRVEDADHGGQVVGLIEELDKRQPVLYTKMAVDQSDRWVRQTVDRSPWLDRLWLSSPILFELWRREHRDGAELAGRLMLLSGGLDSAAVAAIEGPTRALFIDYGQVPAEAEWAAAQAVARHLSLDVERLCVDVSSVGSGLLADTPQMPGAPTPEWFPFRNQFLVTIAAACAAKHGLGAVLLGVVAGDGDRHSDGTAQFVSTLDMLVRNQEGHVRVLAPQITTPARQLLVRSNLPQEVLSQTHSCHASNDSCGECPGCRRRDEIMTRVFPPTA